ncbi:MAG: zinc-binding dehydrogenase [Pseudomonadota bacterium]
MLLLLSSLLLLLLLLLFLLLLLLAEPAEAASFEIVLDAVGAGPTRAAAIAAVAPGGVIAHVGLQDSGGPFDVRTLTLQEITLIGVYTYNDGDLRASLAALADGRLGALDWVEERPLADGGQAFHDLDAGRSAAAKIVLRP